MEKLVIFPSFQGAVGTPILLHWIIMEDIHISFCAVVRVPLSSVQKGIYIYNVVNLVL